MDNDPELKEWASDWQAGHDHAASEEAVRQYSRGRGRTLAVWMIAELAVGFIFLPLLVYMGWAATDPVERLAMAALAFMTIGAMWFGWWNWSSVIDSSARTTSEFVALSVRRLQHMRQAWWVGWGLLAFEFVVFSIWIWNRLYGGGRPHSDGAEQFAWSWLAGVTLIAVVSLIVMDRWITRDADRFEALRRDLETPDAPVISPHQPPPTSGPGRAPGLRARLRSGNRAVPR